MIPNLVSVTVTVTATVVRKDGTRIELGTIVRKPRVIAGNK